MLRLILLSLVLLASACVQIDSSCEPVAGLTPLCGVQMPEDLAALPDEGGLLVASYGDYGKLPGYLSWIQPGDPRGFVTVFDGDDLPAATGEAGWGEALCVVPERFSPHGIHLSRRGEVLQLLVVNHAEREQVLALEVQPRAGQAPVLAWRGCVTMPDNATINDVAALPDGGFAVTHMGDGVPGMLAQLQVLLGANPGYVWRWHPERGLEVIPGTEGGLPNGIEVAADGRSIWVNNYLGREVKQYDLASGETLQVVPVPHVDNSAWLEDGRLLLASHTMALPKMMQCFGVTEGSCGGGFELVAVDPASGATEVIYARPDGGPFGPATVAVPYRGRLYAGSFSGDRLAEIELPAPR